MVKRLVFKYSFLWIPAAVLFAAACSDNGMCACSYAPTPQICNEAAVTQTAEALGTQAVTRQQTTEAADYPTYPPMPLVTASHTPRSAPTTIASQTTPTVTATITPPDPRVLRTPTPLPLTSTPGPSGLPLLVTDIRLDGGACYVALIDELCYWQEVERVSRDGAGPIVTMVTGCSPHLEATFDVDSGVVEVHQVAPTP